MPKKANRFDWGIYLQDRREWADLPPRLRKPSLYNCDLVPGLLDVMARLARDGHQPELKQIPKRELDQMRKERK